MKPSGSGAGAELYVNAQSLGRGWQGTCPVLHGLSQSLTNFVFGMRQLLADGPLGLALPWSRALGAARRHRPVRMCRPPYCITSIVDSN